LYLKADAANEAGEVAEYDEGNNVSAPQTITIGADLRVLTLDVSGDVTQKAAGDQVTVMDTTKNVSPAPVGASKTNFYLITGTTLDGSEVLLSSRDVPPLDPTAIPSTATHSAETTLTLPANAAGAFRIIAKADGNNAIPETNEDNNLSGVSGVFRLGPDLVAELDVPGGAKFPGVGATITVTDVARNNGLTPAPASTVWLYYSAVGTFDGSAVMVGSRRVPALGKKGPTGINEATEITFTLPAGDVGLRYLYLKADAANGVGEVAEYDEGNNVSAPQTITIGGDLKIVLFDVSGSVTTMAAGDQVPVTDTTKNVSGGPVGASKTKFYLITGTTLDGSAVLLDSRDVPPLPTGTPPATSHTATTTLTLPDVLGTFRIIAKADADNEALEIDENNNVSTPSAPFTIGPDLTVLGISVPGRSDPGAKNVPVSDFTKNLGGGAAPGSRTGYYLSRDAVLGAGDVLLGRRTINPLSGRETAFDETTVDIPPTTTPGCYFIVAAADDEGAVQEFDETNNAPREVARPIQIGYPGRTLACAATDFNFDRKSDILWRHSEGAAGIWIMNGAGVVSTAVPATPTLEWEIAGTGDFNADGRVDVLWRDTQSGAVGIWLMDVTGTSIASMAVPASPPLEWVVQGVGDFNGDGKADILWRETSSGAVGIWIMNGTSITSIGEPARPPLDWVIQGVGDFNLDNKADILWRETSSGAVGIWLMDGTTLVSTAIPATPPLEWVVQGVGDFNGDGKADILWRETSSGAIGIWLMDGTTLVSTAIPASPPLEWVIQGVGDFNGDGRADILWREGDGALAIWLMDGVEIRSMAAPAFVGPPATPISVGPEWTIE
jgi:hypothetical protein